MTSMTPWLKGKVTNKEVLPESFLGVDSSIFIICRNPLDLGLVQKRGLEVAEVRLFVFGAGLVRDRGFDHEGLLALLADESLGRLRLFRSFDVEDPARGVLDDVVRLADQLARHENLARGVFRSAEGAFDEPFCDHFFLVCLSCHCPFLLKVFADGSARSAEALRRMPRKRPLRGFRLCVNIRREGAKSAEFRKIFLKFFQIRCRSRIRPSASAGFPRFLLNWPFFPVSEEKIHRNRFARNP